MVDKAKTKKVMKQFTPVRANIASAGGIPFELPNHSRGKEAESDKGLVNKKYVDDGIDADITTHTAISNAHHTKYTNSEADARVDLKIDDGTTAGQMAFWNGTKWVKTETSELIWDDTNKRVGIGTSSPSSTFHVDGTSGTPTTANSLMTLRDSTSNIGFQMGATSGYGWIRAADVGVSHLTYGRLIMGNDYVSLGDGSDDAQFYLDTTDGNVGIGTTSPDKALDIMVNTPDDGLIIQNSAGTGFIDIGAYAYDPDVSYYTQIRGKPTGDYSFKFRGIKSATGSDSTPVFVLQAANSAETGAIDDDQVAIELQNWGTKLMTLMGNGDVGIGTTTPHSKLEVNGAISSAVLAVTSANDGTIAVGGINNIFIDASTAAVVINDFTGGVAGQVMHLVVKTPDASNTVTITDTSGSNQELYNHSEADYVFETDERGGFTFICDGSNWYDTSHAKHV